MEIVQPPSLTSNYAAFVAFIQENNFSETLGQDCNFSYISGTLAFA